MEHHGGKIPWDAYLVCGVRSACHLVADAHFPEIYESQMDHDGLGNAVWFDTFEEAQDFIGKNFPVIKRMKGEPWQESYMPRRAEYFYRAFCYVLCRFKDRIAVMDEETNKIVDSNDDCGYATESEAWESFGRKFFASSPIPDGRTAFDRPTAPQPEASARGRANIDIIVLLKCSRCGKEFNPADGCVDIFTKPKSDGSLGFEFSVKAHKESTDSPFATLCLDCIEKWLQDSGVEKCEAKRIVEQYRPKNNRG